MRRQLGRLFNFGNAVTIVTIILGVLASAGLTEKFWPTELVMVAIVTLLATQLLVDRMGILTKIRDSVAPKSDPLAVRMIPRTSVEFERFSQFCAGAKDVLVVGVDMGFLANSDGWFLKELLDEGANVRILMCNPSVNGELSGALNAQDERNGAAITVHDHAAQAEANIRALERLAPVGANRGTLEVRKRADIPSPGLTIVDVNEPGGRIRVEIKLYKRNHGAVPYFIIDHSSAWYEVFRDHYYVKLWNDSPTIYKSV